MDYEKIISGVMQHRVGEFIVTDMTGDILYRNHVEPFSNSQWKIWVDLNLDPENLEVEQKWEISDKAKESYYSVISVPVTEDHEQYIVHHIFNTTEYVTLLRDVSQYSREWKNLSSFQSKLLEALTGDNTDSLSLILKALKLNSIHLFIRRNHFTKEFILKKGEETYHVNKSDDRLVFTARVNRSFILPGQSEPLFCYINDVTVDGVRYALFVEKSDEHTGEEFSMYFHVIRLFLENSLMREHIIYENEHDALTGLYNKGKYLSMMEDFFPKCERIAVFNMDLNYLKRTNDNLGHEAGDKLLIRAANSLLAVESKHVKGFRMGGDEFLLIAWDIDKEKADEIKEKWEAALADLNAKDPSFECVIACGAAYGDVGFNLSEILKQADERMYENKVAIKIARGEDPNSR